MDYIDKPALRKVELDRRRLISPEDKELWDAAIVERTIEHLQQAKPRVIHVFRALKSLNEIDTTAIIEWAISHRTRVYSTLRVEGAWRIVRFAPEGHFAPEDPKRVDVILIPLLAFDDKLHRLGYGGGYYDRLSRRYPKAVRVGLAYANQQVDELPAEEHDVPLHAVITEKEVYKA